MSSWLDLTGKDHGGMWDRHTWSVVMSSIAAGVSILALIRSFWVDKVRLNVNIKKTSSGDRGETWNIDITNKGRHTIVVNSIYWSIGRRQLSTYCSSPRHKHPPYPFQKDIRPGYTSTAVFELNCLQENLTSIPTRNLKKLRLYILTSIEQGYRFPIGDALLSKILSDAA